MPLIGKNSEVSFQDAFPGNLWVTAGRNMSNFESVKMTLSR